MSERLRYVLRMALRLKLGVWATEAEIDALADYLTSQKITIGESD